MDQHLYNFTALNMLLVIIKCIVKGSRNRMYLLYFRMLNLILCCTFLLCSTVAIPNTYYKKDIELINKRSHLLMQSLPQAMLSESSYNSSAHFKDKVKTLNFLRVCYYVFGNPPPEKINTTLCTHIVGAFTIIENGMLAQPSGEDEKLYFATTNLKKDNPYLKVMLSVGGGGADAGFSSAVSGNANRTKLALSAITTLKKYNFDGLDIDWEFPVWNDFVTGDKHNFILFLQKFRMMSSVLSKESLLLSVAVGAPKPIVDKSYDIPAMAKYVDFVNLMSYDYHDYSFYMPFTGHNSPLFHRSVEHAYFSTLNTAWSARYWNKNGMPMSQIMVGLPTYGHTYKLLDPNLHGFDAPSVGYGIGNGSITYPEVCMFLKKGGVRVFDTQSQVPYAYYNYDWIAFDDKESLSSKAKWVKSEGYGGIMTFDLNCDDWQGVCGGETFPLHRTIFDIFTKQ